MLTIVYIHHIFWTTMSSITRRSGFYAIPQVQFNPKKQVETHAPRKLHLFEVKHFTMVDHEGDDVWWWFMVVRAGLRKHKKTTQLAEHEVKSMGASHCCHHCSQNKPSSLRLVLGISNVNRLFKGYFRWFNHCKQVIYTILGPWYLQPL